ncbi:hypothetical protein [Flavobacterium urocaniciphilum]|uniref:LSU ribosomal protein L21p n=1 Tax=Flavobacterium urocaniciphilum TaxID=1299341 RepID=A0A1H9AEP6_9FLAO|nr:hypothetical protein [Flavobacterium urocaniciphilum]SEP75045.1 hypothetical protein SAMN05444005_102106 [Flavobacterium urocaniciphilum]
MDNYLQLASIALIFGIIGYLIGKLTSKSNVNSDSNLKFEFEKCLLEKKDLQAEVDKLNLEFYKTNQFVDTTISQKSFDSVSAKEILGKKIKENDLKIVEGIGPKIETLFNTSGILTWKALAESSIDRLREILSKAGERYQIYDPSTWPKQAKFAYEGKWQELKDMQNSLDSGREV